MTRNRRQNDPCYPYTVETVREHIRGKLEDTETPNRVLEVLQKFQGKKITKRFFTELNRALGHEFRFWWLPIGRGSYRHFPIKVQPAGAGYSDPPIAWIDLQGPNDTYSEAETRRGNPSCFGAAEERNQQRHAILRDDETVQALAKALNDVHEARERFRVLVGYGQAAGPDYRDFERWVGVSSD